MKIALAHKRLDLGAGTERDFYRTAEGLRDLGHEIHLFCGRYAIAPPQGVQAHRVPLLPLGRTAQLLSFAVWGPKLIRSYKSDVVVNFGRMTEQDVLRSGGGVHRRFLEKMESEDGWMRHLWHRISIYHRSTLAVEKRQYRPGSYRKIVAVSDEVKREIMSTYEVPDNKITVIYNGVDHTRFHSAGGQGTRQMIRKQWGIPSEAPVVLFVGSGFRRKGLDRLLNLWSSEGLKGVYLLVVGDDARHKRYRLWASREAGKRVIFAGRRADIENYYHAADLLALPAIQEAFGNVILEAIACGLPVLVSQTVGAAEILRDELREGIVADPENKIEMEAKLLWLLDQSRRRFLAEKATKLGKEFSWENHFRKLESCLLEVSEQRRFDTAS